MAPVQPEPVRECPQQELRDDQGRKEVTGVIDTEVSGQQGRETGQGVPAEMPGIDVAARPQPLVAWNREVQLASWNQQRTHHSQECAILFDMFDDVEHADSAKAPLPEAG